MAPEPEPELIEFVEQRDIQRDFRDPISHLWTVADESSLNAETSVGRSALFVEPSARQRVIERGPGWPHGYDNDPAFVEHWREDERVREYLPTGNDEGLHALVITQSGISFSASIRAASGCRHRESTSRRSATMSCTISRTPASWVESATRLAP